MPIADGTPHRDSCHRSVALRELSGALVTLFSKEPKRARRLLGHAAAGRKKGKGKAARAAPATGRPPPGDRPPGGRLADRARRPAMEARWLLGVVGEK